MAFNERTSLSQNGFSAGGGTGVYYDDTGRVQYGGPPARVGSSCPPAASRSSNFFWRSNDNCGAANDNSRSRWGFFPWSFGGQTKSVVQVPPPTRTRYDEYTMMPGLGYREYVRPAATQQVTQRRITLPPSGQDQLVVEEMKIYDIPPPWWWLFILIGSLLIVTGILAWLWCITYHFYCRFWTGAALIILGILGAIHRGDYYRYKWKSIIYIIFGVITAGCVYACICWDLEWFTHELIEIGQFNDGNDNYIAEMEFRYAYLTIRPRYVINSDISINIWVCFALDGIALVLLTLGFLVLTSVVVVIDQYFNSNWVITRLVEPFYAPCIFNPWGQVSMGQAMIYVGFVLNGSVHGDFIVLYQFFLAPVWAGIVPILAGITTALAFKSLGLGRRCLELLSIVLELISLIISVIAIIICFIGMVQNVQTLQQSWVMNYTLFSQMMMVASSFIYCIAIVVCLANIIYSAVLLIRLIVHVCCTATESVPVSYVYEDPATVVPLTKETVVTQEVKSYGGLWNRQSGMGPRPQFVDAGPYQAGRMCTVE